MLVSVDTDRGVVTVYGAAIITIPINQFAKLRAMLSGKRVQYISEVTDASGDDVLEMIGEMAGTQTFTTRTAAPIDTDGKLWMRATGSGQLYLPLDGRKPLKFENPSEFICLDKIGYDIAEKHYTVNALLKKGKLEIVTTSRMHQIKRIEAQKQAEKEEKMYGNLIVKDDVRADKYRDTISSKYAIKGEYMEIDSTQKASEFISDDIKTAIAQGWGKPDPEDEAEAEPEAQ